MFYAGYYTGIWVPSGPLLRGLLIGVAIGLHRGCHRTPVGLGRA